MHSSPSIVPDQDDRDIYFVLDDFGGRPAGSIASTVESDPEGRQREAAFRFFDANFHNGDL